VLTQVLWQSLKTGGIYVVEDISENYIEKHYLDKGSFTQFMKNAIDVVQCRRAHCPLPSICFTLFVPSFVCLCMPSGPVMQSMQCRPAPPPHLLHLCTSVHAERTCTACPVEQRAAQQLPILRMKWGCKAERMSDSGHTRGVLLLQDEADVHGARFACAAGVHRLLRVQPHGQCVNLATLHWTLLFSPNREQIRSQLGLARCM
jgi:hypothetical protein